MRLFFILMRSNSVDQYILQKNGELRIMYEILNDFLTSDEIDLSSTLKYGIPFYLHKGKMVCYLHMCKDNSLDITFWKGKDLQKLFPQLQQRNRKIMASLNYQMAEDLDLELIRDIVDATRSSLEN